MLDFPPYFCGYMPYEPTGEEAREIDNYIMQIAKRDNERYERHMALLRLMLLGILIHDLKKIQERRSS